MIGGMDRRYGYRYGSRTDLDPDMILLNKAVNIDGVTENKITSMYGAD